MAALISDIKCLVLIDKNYYSVVKNTAGYHPGQVKPSTAGGAPFNQPLMKESEDRFQRLYGNGHSSDQMLREIASINTKKNSSL